MAQRRKNTDLQHKLTDLQGAFAARSSRDIPPINRPTPMPLPNFVTAMVEALGRATNPANKTSATKHLTKLKNLFKNNSVILDNKDLFRQQRYAPLCDLLTGTHASKMHLSIFAVTNKKGETSYLPVIFDELVRNILIVGSDEISKEMRQYSRDQGVTYTSIKRDSARRLINDFFAYSKDREIRDPSTSQMKIKVPPLPAATLGSAITCLIDMPDNQRAEINTQIDPTGYYHAITKLMDIAHGRIDSAVYYTMPLSPAKEKSAVINAIPTPPERS